MSSFDYDVIFVGGGLAGGLAAFLLALERPEVRCLLVDSGRPPTWEQTWSFQVLKGDSDPTRTKAFQAPMHSWLAPFISGYWDAYTVNFPRQKRLIEHSYVSIRHQDFIQALKGRLKSAYRPGALVKSLGPHSVAIDDGSTWTAACVIDARGWGPVDSGKTSGYQKFLGLHLRTKGSHGLENPILMDVEIPQVDGFRFMYVLPWAHDELLIEDTHYSNGPHVDALNYRREIEAYALSKNWVIDSVLGEEIGSLPIPAYGAEKPDNGQQATLGARAGFYHPTTGYSIYEAVLCAEWIAQQKDWHSQHISKGLRALSKKRWKELEFYRRLNNMLFFAAADDERYRVLEKFYEHQEDLVARFYAGQTHGRDKLKILSGRPPVPVKRGIYHFFHKVGASYGPN